MGDAASQRLSLLLLIPESVSQIQRSASTLSFDPSHDALKLGPTLLSQGNSSGFMPAFDPLLLKQSPHRLRRHISELLLPNMKIKSQLRR